MSGGPRRGRGQPEDRRPGGAGRPVGRRTTATRQAGLGRAGVAGGGGLRAGGAAAAGWGGGGRRWRGRRLVREEAQ
jgi:hypothetical protein